MAAMLLETKEFLSILALADRESIQARSELLAYNILPLDHGGISGAPQDNNIMLWNDVIFGLDDTPWDGGNKVNNIDDYYFDYLWCKDYKYIKVIFSDCRETSASQPRVHEDWITRNVADVVCIVFFITKIYLIKKIALYFLLPCNVYSHRQVQLVSLFLICIIYFSFDSKFLFLL
ncbi:hypothetical protein ES332_D07G169600v1 [Gossypium tomentosum]|uniref:UBC core domain-containing protein n=1 Tax=Gossypium tomentosum TaxID=34277 RepID=A0A5D2K8B3_GOSTO|nr:hypothetical protein ES332_D07G169600v1 [Gossypium tomentosum]